MGLWTNGRGARRRTDDHEEQTLMQTTLKRTCLRCLRKSLTTQTRHVGLYPQKEPNLIKQKRTTIVWLMSFFHMFLCHPLQNRPVPMSKPATHWVCVSGPVSDTTTIIY